MPALLRISPTALSITLNKADGVLYGDTVLYVMSLSDEYVYFSYDDVFNLNPPNVVNGEVQILGAPGILNLAEGTYNYEIFASATDFERTIPVTLTVVNAQTGGGGNGGGLIFTGGGDSPVIFVPKSYYGLKYFLEWTGVDGVLFRLNLECINYDGEPVEIHGSALHGYQDKKDHFEPIIASNLDITLDADTDLTLQDLYSENERDYKATLYRNGKVIFTGFIKPDGIYEDWVSDRWQLSIDAYDGLSILKNLYFVKESGLRYYGNMQVIEVISKCLSRIGLNLPINVCVDLYADDGTPAIETIISTERYRQEGSEEPMDCEAVVKSLLQILNATLIQQDGEWWIYRTIDVKDDMAFTKYKDGQKLSEFIYSPVKTIGSHVNDPNRSVYDAIHSKGRQTKSIKASVQAYRIRYQFGVSAESKITNPELNFSGATNTIDGWTLQNGWQRTANGDLRISAVKDATNLLQQVVISNPMAVVNGDILTLTISLLAKKGIVSLYYKIQVGNYWYKDGEWKTADAKMMVTNKGYAQDTNIDITTELPPIPENGNLVVTFYTPFTYSQVLTNMNVYTTPYIDLYTIDIHPSTQSNKKGIIYTAQRISRVSTVTKEDVTVYNGDSVSNIYVGTIFKPDGTPTKSWHRGGIDESKELLAIAVEDNLRIAPKPMIIFDGDIVGFIPYLSLVKIAAVGDYFQPSKYSFDTLENGVSTTFLEFSNGYLQPETFTIDIADDVGDATNVKIKS